VIVDDSRFVNDNWRTQYTGGIDYPMMIVDRPFRAFGVKLQFAVIEVCRFETRQ